MPNARSSRGEADTPDRTVGEITHDLNNVLTSVLGYAEMIAEDAEASSVDVRDARQLLAATREAVALAKVLRSAVPPAPPPRG